MVHVLYDHELAHFHVVFLDIHTFISERIEDQKIPSVSSYGLDVSGIEVQADRESIEI